MFIAASAYCISNVWGVIYAHDQQRGAHGASKDWLMPDTRCFAACRAAQPLNLDAERQPRTPEQMAKEAAELRPLFQSP